MNSPDPAVVLRDPTAPTRESLQSRSTGDAAARFEHLVRENQTAIFRVAYRLTGNRDEAEDLVQEALVEAFEAFGRFRPGTHFDRWVFRIMRNTFLDARRRREKARLHVLDSGAEGEARTHAAARISPFSADTAIMARTLDGPIQDALDALPAEFKMVVILADIEGLTYEEISEVLARPLGTVRSRLHRGRMILKERLRSYVRA